MSQGKRIFIDCGGHDGCPVVQFLSGRPDFSCVTFEPNHVTYPDYRFLPTRLVRKAVSTHDGTVEFIVGPLDGDGSSLLEGKDVVHDGSLADTECPRVVVGCLDLSGCVKAHVRSEDYLGLKIDVGGRRVRHPREAASGRLGLADRPGCRCLVRARQGLEGRSAAGDYGVPDLDPSGPVHYRVPAHSVVTAAIS